MSLALSLAPYVFGGHDPSDPVSPRVGRRAQDVSDTPETLPPPDAAELALLVRIREGDVAAFETIVLRYAEPLARFGTTLTRERDTGEEIAYQALERLWERRAQLRTSRSVAPYLFTIARNLAAHKLARARVRERFAAHTRADAVLDTDAHTAAAPDALLDAHDDATTYAAHVTALRAAVDALPERRREVLYLRFEQGLSYPAIGAIVGLSDKAVQQLVLRTIGALRRTLVR